MFRTEAESRAFFESGDFLLALVGAVLAAGLLMLFLTRTRPGRLVFKLALTVLLVGCLTVLYRLARLAAVLTGVG